VLSLNWIIAHWGDKKRHVFEPLALSLGALGHRCTWIARDQMTGRPELLGAIRSREFDGLLTWQRFYPMQRDVLEALAATDIATLYMDYGFVPHYDSVVFDPVGENAVSALRMSWSRSAGASGDAPDVPAMVREREPSWLEDDLAPCDAVDRVEYPFVFVPLQRPGDSVIRYDSRVHNFGQLVRRVLMLARGRHFVVIKTHPLDASLDLGVPEYVRGSHLVIRSGFGAQNESLNGRLLRDASLVVGINSNMLFRAILYGKNVIATGAGWYSGSGAVVEVDGWEGLLSLSTSGPDLAARRRYVSACLERQLLISELSNAAAVERVLKVVNMRVPRQRHEAAPVHP
jgi:hypothetical protein